MSFNRGRSNMLYDGTPVTERKQPMLVHATMWVNLSSLILPLCSSRKSKTTVTEVTSVAAGDWRQTTKAHEEIRGVLRVR